MRSRIASLSTVATLLATTTLVSGLLVSSALASGYDTPIIHTARNIGMGGTAIGHVNDPSALYHNPAGLGHIKDGGQALVAFSPLVGQLTGSPNSNSVNAKSERGLIPMFMVGAAYNVTSRLTLGAGVFPLGGGSGEYKYEYDDFGTQIKEENFTSLAFIEIDPLSIAYEFDFLGGKLRMGAAYRVTLAQFQRRVTKPEKSPPLDTVIDLNMSGMDTAGFRVGLQGTYGDLDIGAVFRSGITVPVETVDGHDAKVLGVPAKDVKFEFKIPPQLGVGARLRLTEKIRLAADMNMLFNTYNDKSTLTGIRTSDNVEVSVDNYAKWDDGLMMRFGGEYMLSEGTYLRAGYVYDTKSANTKYPSAFGTPPGPTNSFTLGAEMAVTKKISVAVAVAYRSGAGPVAKEQLADVKNGDKLCGFCGVEGDYAINMLGGYLDAVFKF